MSPHRMLSFVRALILGPGVALGLVASGGPAMAQAPSPHQAIYQYKGADRDARLLERARQEGTVSVYTLSLIHI